MFIREFFLFSMHFLTSSFLSSRGLYLFYDIIAFIKFYCSFFKTIFDFQAEAKNATATEYGFVIGSYELVGFLSSPFFGKIVNNSLPFSFGEWLLC